MLVRLELDASPSPPPSPLDSHPQAPAMETGARRVRKCDAYYLLPAESAPTFKTFAKVVDTSATTAPPHDLEAHRGAMDRDG
eukprot:g742.t1